MTCGFNSLSPHYMPFFLTFILILLHLTLSPLHPSPIVPAFSLLTPTPSPIATSKSTSKPIPTPTGSDPWGKLIQLSEHTYKIRVQDDTVMTTSDELLAAINVLRAKNGAQPLQKSARLCDYAALRAKLFDQIKSTDEHAGFKKYLESEDGFHKLGYGSIGENSSYGYRLSGTHLVEFVYMRSPGHNANQLNPAWDHGCAGVSGLGTDIIFATSPL